MLPFLIVCRFTVETVHITEYNFILSNLSEKIKRYTVFFGTFRFHFSIDFAAIGKNRPVRKIGIKRASLKIDLQFPFKDDTIN